MELCVVGLGKIGLPIAVQAAGSGIRVRGIDIQPAVVEQVNASREPFPGEPGLGDRLKAVVGAGRLTATTEVASAVSVSAAVIVVVPLLVGDDDRPEFGFLDAATEAIGSALSPGTLVSYETTMPVETTRKRLAPMLTELSGLELGKDLFVVHSPERVYSGRVFADLRRYPKLVGGIDAESTRRGVDLYESILQFDERNDLSRANGVWALGSVEAAEFAKLAETTYRNVNIGLANEFAVYAESHGLDVHEVIEASNSQPFSAIHQPGVAVGGHCIPVYPKFYLANDPAAELPAASIRVNEAMPKKVVETIRSRMGSLNGRRVVVLGAAYRGGVRETAFSGVFPLVRELEAVEAIPLVHDPLYDDRELRLMGLKPYHLGESCDVAVLQAAHEEYRSLSPADLPEINLFYDGRAAMDPDRWLGVQFIQLGKGA